MNSQEYYQWLSKFETRNTSDDTFTPPAVYDVVVDYVHHHIINLDNLNIVRPFYPNGDYKAFEYGENDIVIDNPPFSISTQIYNFYVERGIKFFLFAPALTAFQACRNSKVSVVIAPQPITYDNGAKMNTSFATNLLGEVRVKTAPNLYQALAKTQTPEKTLPKYQYPDNMLMVSDLQKLCRAGLEFEIGFNESYFVKTLDSQRTAKKTLFGGGLLISNQKAEQLKDKKLKAEQLKAINDKFVWQLSDREIEIINETLY